MRIKFTFAFVIFAFVFLVSGNAGAQTNTNHFRALVLAERGDQHEPFVAAALKWLKTTAQQDDFSIDVFENPDQFTKSFLTNYQVFIQLNYPPYRWSDTARSAFQGCTEQGGVVWFCMGHPAGLG